MTRFQLYFIKIVLIVLVVSAMSFLSSRLFGIQFGQENYWDHHGILLLFFLATFPRLTFLFSSLATGGFIWWLGWVFAPRILVATLATFSYWEKNPLLVIASWLIAISGEATEKIVVVRRAQNRARYRQQFEGRGEIIDIQKNP